MHYSPQQSYNYEGMYSIPSSPIGNIVPLGYGGYNGGYYSNNYNNFNPFEIQKQREIQLAQERESQRNQSDIFKKLHTASSSYLGLEVSEEDLKRYDPVFEEDEISGLDYEERERYYRIKEAETYRNAHQNIIYNQNELVPCISVEGYNCSNLHYEMSMKAKQEIPNDVGLNEYLEKYAPKKYIEALEREQLEAQKDLTRMYNKADYKSLLDIHKKGNVRKDMFGNAFNPNASIDDQEITLPSFITEKTRQERRQAFMSAIMGGGK